MTFARLGPNRTLQGAADELGKSLGLMKEWSLKYKWVERSRHYDNWVQTPTDEARKNQLQLIQAQITSQELEDYKKLRDIFVQATDKLKERAAEMELEDLTNSLRRLVMTRDTLSASARRSARMATSITSEVEEGNPYDGDVFLSIDELPRIEP